MPCRRLDKRGPNIRWKSPNSNTASPTAAPPRPIAPRDIPSPKGLGDVLMLRGRYDEAADCFQRAAELADGEFAKAKIQGKIGELAFKRGDMESATLAFESTLRLLGKHVPRRMPVFLLWLVWEVVVQTLHTLLPRVFVHRRKRQPTAAELLGFRMFSRLAHGYWFVRGSISALVGPSPRHEPCGTLSANR